MFDTDIWLSIQEKPLDFIYLKYIHLSFEFLIFLFRIKVLTENKLYNTKNSGRKTTLFIMVGLSWWQFLKPYIRHGLGKSLEYAQSELKIVILATLLIIVLFFMVMKRKCRKQFYWREMWLKCKKIQIFDKNPLFFEILTVLRLFSVNVWSKNLLIWPCSSLFRPLANWFEVLPLRGTSLSIQSQTSNTFL